MAVRHGTAQLDQEDTSMLGSARSVLMKPSTAPSFPAPIAAYAMNENTGTTTADASGNGHTATLNNASWTTGHTGSGLTNLGNTLGANTAVFAAPSTAITLMAWINPTSLPAGGSDIACGFFDSGNTDVAIFTQRGDGFGPANVLQGNIRLGATLISISGSALTVGTWVHIALTYDGSNIRLYVNSSLVNTVAGTGAVSPGDNLTVCGPDSGNAGGSYHARLVIDDVRVFNTALTQTQISAAMATPV